MPSKRLIAGAMSGTSADGVDVAIVEVEGRGLAMKATPVAHAYSPFPADLRRQILDVRQRGEIRLSDLAEIGRQVTLAHVPAFRAALAKANVTPDQVEAIAAHGQTLFHGPPNTIQYFDPSLLAFETGCAVVSDFRRADLAAGGQGAPLVPFADWILLRHPTENRVVLNLGGIANITILKAGCSVDDIIAFDTGPGNCLSDYLMREQGGCDVGGELALKGVESRSILYAIDFTYFEQLPPKSTDGPAMVAIFEAARRADPNASLPDLLATASCVTVSTIGRGLDSACPGLRDVRWICAGGGIRNESIMTRLRHAQYSASVTTSLDYGIATDAREAIAFALLAAATLDGEPSNVPSATGASRRVVLGSITPKSV